MIFVYYNDDYYEMGGAGLESFGDVKEAEKFILKRLNASEGRKLSDYTVIDGEEVKIEIVEKISTIKINT